ncbi:MAG: YkgJ family cysteine cluster protein [Deltaproteobacteria bacterium]|nr:YkgJ family cysteine cluster protein [Deltaproteobacteria bacterium]
MSATATDGGSPPLRFECTQCGKCCWTRGEYAHVYVTRQDMARMSASLGLEPKEFRYRFTLRDEDGWVELDFPGGRCVFLDPLTNLCQVYAVRPTQCQTFPFWPELLRAGGWTAEARRMCEGVGEGRQVPAQEVAARLEAQRRADES